MNIITNHLSHFSMSGKWLISSPKMAASSVMGPATVRPPKRRRFAWLGDGQWPRTEMAPKMGRSGALIYVCINIIYNIIIYNNIPLNIYICIICEWIYLYIWICNIVIYNIYNNIYIYILYVNGSISGLINDSGSRI